MTVSHPVMKNYGKLIFFIFLFKGKITFALHNKIHTYLSSTGLPRWH